MRTVRLVGRRPWIALGLAAALGVALGACRANPVPGEKTGGESEGEGKASGKDYPMVEITTSLGTIKVELYPDKAPKTVANFLAYVDDKFYDGTIFHRVISTFMIQGGGYDQSMQRKETRAPVVNEASNGLSNARGTIAMARTSDPDSATAQFFINVKDNAQLDRRDATPMGAGYCVFGKVVSGMDVVDKIKAVPTGVKNGMKDVPETPVLIQSVRRVK
jgi:cyclophilin family peptidyl-prolyl cis-trans isomerase